MKKLYDELKTLFHSKIYLMIVGLSATCAYGYAVTHHAIGMDDTVIPLYYEEGLAPYVGRWSLFIINKLFHIADFIPWMVELVSVLILILSVTLWCILWKRICEPKVVLPLWSYAFMAAIFLSCPLISEVYVFYLHNGICTGYGVTALALICFMDSLKTEETKQYRIKQGFLSAVLLTVALGFYESFIMVYVLGAVMCFFLIRVLYGKRNEASGYQTNILYWIGNGLLIAVISVVLRMAILAILSQVYQLDKLDNYDVLYRNLFGNIFTIEGEFAMILKRFFVKYYVNAILYLPITVLVVSMIFIGIYSLYKGIRKRDIMLPLCSVALVIFPVFMSIIEGLATRYRSAQYVPLIGAFAVLLLLIELHQYKMPKWVFVGCYLFLSVLLYNQCTDMNRWFYLDDLKYQDAKEVINQVAYDLEKGYDISKPIIFIGAYEVPYEITKDVYVSFASPEYRWISRLTDWIDPHLKEKYHAGNGKGYIFAESPIISVLQWGLTAFDGTSQQLIEFMKMHGHDNFHCETDLAVIQEIHQLHMEDNMPSYPKAGYIKECEDYIIVNLSNI